MAVTRGRRFAPALLAFVLAAACLRATAAYDCAATLTGFAGSCDCMVAGTNWIRVRSCNQTGPTTSISYDAPCAASRG